MQVLTITMIRSLFNNRILCRHLKVTTFYYRHCHDGALELERMHKLIKSENEKSHLEKIIDDWIRFIKLEMESTAKMEADSKQKYQFMGKDGQRVKFHAINCMKNPKEGGIILELSLDQFDADTMHKFLEIYRTRSRVLLRPANANNPDSTEEDMVYEAVIRRNKDNVLCLLLLELDDQNLNLHEIQAVNEWAIRIIPEYNKFYKQLKRFYESEAYLRCKGFPQLLKCFGQMQLDRVSEENREMITLSEELNDSQKAAIHSALNEQQNFVAIHGPPGTGKTRVIAEIGYQQLLRREIIICAPSNKAVDNTLSACLALGVPADKCIRLGFTDSDNETIYSTQFRIRFQQHGSYQNLLVLCEERDLKKDELQSSSDAFQKDIKKKGFDAINEKIKELRKAITADIMRNVKIIFCTAFCIELFYRILDSRLFEPDLIVMDECAQILEPTTWHMLLNARRFVLVGDHKQLEPIVLIGKNAGKPITDQSNDEKELAEKMSITLLQRLATNVLKGKKAYLHMLNVNYRSNELINRWSNEHFYNGKLSTHNSVKDITLEDIVKRPKSKIVGKAKDKTTQKDDQFFIQEPLVLVDTALFTEADHRECLRQYQPNLLDFHEQKKSGSISFFNTGEALCSVLHLLALQSAGLQPQDIGCITPYNAQTRLIKKLLGAHDFDVSSVDAFQGQQREAIVMSFARSNYWNYIGFMENLNRMNVAITRAKRQFFLIASSRSLKSNRKLKELYKLIHREGRIVHPKELLLKSSKVDETIENEENRSQNRNRRKA